MKVYGEGVSWLDTDTKTPLPKDGEHFDAGYIRVYMNGSTEGNTNHVVELEVMGETGDVVIKDEEAPTSAGQSESRISEGDRKQKFVSFRQ